MTEAKRIYFLSVTHKWDDNRILHKEARALQEAGYQTTHLCPGETERIWVHPNGVTVHQYQRKSGLFGKLRHMIHVFRILHWNPVDVMHCNELESWVVGVVLGWLHRERVVVFDVHEHYPSRFDGPEYSAALRWLGKWTVRPAVHGLIAGLRPFTDAVVFAKRGVGPDFRAYGPERCEYIFNYADRRIVESQPTGELPRDFPVDKFVVLHVGSFSRNTGWHIALRALAQTDDPGVVLVSVGTIKEGKSAFLDLATELKVADRVFVYDTVPYEQIFLFMRNARVGLLLYQPGMVNHVHAFPMKLYDYMAISLPVIGPSFALEVAPVIASERCGILIDTSNPAELKEAILVLRQDEAERREMGKRATAAVERIYHWEAQARHLREFYHRILHELEN